MSDDHYDPLASSPFPEAQRIVAMRRAFFARCEAPPPPGLDDEQGRVYNMAMAQAETYLSAGRTDLYGPMFRAAQAYLDDPSAENAETIEQVSRGG